MTLVTCFCFLICRTTIYVEHMTAWYDVKTHNEVINMKFFSKITNSVGTAGLTGLDRLFSFMIVTELQVCNIKSCISFRFWTEILSWYEVFCVVVMYMYIRMKCRCTLYAQIQAEIFFPGSVSKNGWFSYNQFLYHCVYICCCGNMFIKPLPTNRCLLCLHSSGSQPSCYNLLNILY
jgi:hypothetical protein